MMNARIWRSRRNRSIAGFTLIELLVVIIIIGVLFAITSTGWSAVMNRERLNSVRDQVTQVLRQAQSDAHRSHIPRVVVFDSNPTGIPRAAVLAQKLDTSGQIQGELSATDIATISNWQNLGNGDVQSGVLVMSTVPVGSNAQYGQLVFDSNGAIAPASVSKAGGIAATTTANPRIFAINIQQKNTSIATQRCVIVTTLLGSTRLAEGTGCPTS